MYPYDYTISLGIHHPTAASAGIASRLQLEPEFSCDVGTDLRNREGRLIRVHASTWAIFPMSRARDGWLMEAWPDVVEILQTRADVLRELLDEGAEVRLMIGIFGKTAWAGFELDGALVRLLADLRIRFEVETYFPDEPSGSAEESVELPSSPPAASTLPATK